MYINIVLQLVKKEHKMEPDKVHREKPSDKDWTRDSPDDISIKAMRNCKKCGKNRWVDLWCYYCLSIYPQDKPLSLHQISRVNYQPTDQLL